MSSQVRAFAPRLLDAMLALGVVALLSACVSREAAPEAEVAHRHDDALIEGWQAETFALPPGFAPELPSGRESLRFAPGWRTPDAEDFWSYAFVMWIDEPVPDGTRIDDLLEKYYNGLLASFAAGSGKDISGTPARVDVVRRSPPRYEARMRVIDAFATFEPIELRVLVDSVAESGGRSSLRIRVSPQAKEHAIWGALDAAIASILSREAGAAEAK